MRKATGGTTTTIDIAPTSCIRKISSAEFSDNARMVFATVTVVLPVSDFRKY